MIKFNEDVASEYGVNAAIVAKLLWDLQHDFLKMKKAVDRYGRRWFRCSMKEMVLKLRCLSIDMVKDAVKVLVDNGILRKGNLNDNKFDHTNWYTFTEFGTQLMKRGEWYYETIM